MDYSKLINIQNYEFGISTPEELNEMEVDRFNISNFNMKELSKYKQMSNYYVFPVADKNSSTGYYAMCINKEFAKKVKEAHDRKNK